MKEQHRVVKQEKYQYRKVHICCGPNFGIDMYIEGEKVGISISKCEYLSFGYQVISNFCNFQIFYNEKKTIKHNKLMCSCQRGRSNKRCCTLKLLFSTVVLDW